MRLIDADALKEELEELKKSPWYFRHRKTIDGIACRQAQKETLQIVENIIDNAPTVEPEVKKVPIANVTFDTEKLKELTDEIVDRIKNGEIVLQDERQKGEWIIDFYRLKCPFCGMAIDDEVHWLYSKEFDFNFCPNCGAQMDMRGEEE